MLMRTTTANPALNLEAGAESPAEPQCPALPPSKPVQPPLGSIVVWSSYPPPQYRPHRGVVVAFVPSGEAVPGFWTDKWLGTKLGDFQEYAQIDRYLMRVDCPGKKTRWMCPPAGRIEKAYAAGQKEAENGL